MTGTLAILDARLVDPAAGTITRGNLLVRDRRIAATGSFDLPADAETIDAGGTHVAPGLVDLGIFAIDMPAFTAGGITRAVLMPDQSPPLDHAALVQRAAAAGKPDVWVHPLAAATKGLEGKELAEIGLMKAGGACAVATGRGWIADSGVMLRVLSYARSLGLTVVSHAEDGGITAGAVATEGEYATRMGLPAAPAIAEAMAVARDLMLAEQTGARLHFRQLSTARAFDLVRDAKRRGLPISCGISPAHLLLSDIAVGGFRTFARLSPPLRSEDDRQAALAALADGTIDLICSSHDPQGPEAKRLPFADAEPGMAGAETLLTLSLALVRDGVVTLPRLIELLSTAPARLLGLPGGSLATGAEADLVLFDPDMPWRIDSDHMASRAGNTPFDGLPVQGKVIQTIKGGVLLR
ncbi:amidohydrolase family protein [Sphingomonas histidinilytica]|uniref:Dihydroorotase n=1 Tax=Rhizorhabdus histidinilytica TaxID=439228 RepID=A0A1T5F670_9SPHN|nr:dihydroorotase [Rhizorhabdus histidinilytica]MBO9379555.1 amidohydrolase family protein [Rhizorhabdus histidinilytica]SKB91667.1 dihydroorotase [Rhizorhabdus histidinilytica]